MKFTYLLRFSLALFSISLAFACDKKSSRNNKVMNNLQTKEIQRNNIKAQLTHKKEGKDYVLNFKLPYKVNVQHRQMRIEKQLNIQIANTQLKNETTPIKLGLIKTLTVKTLNGNSNILITLRRPLRYEVKWEDNHSLKVILKNVMRISSIIPKEKEVTDFHYKSYNVDLHNDLLIQLFMRGADFKKGSSSTECDLAKQNGGGAKSLFYAVWVPDYFLKNPDKIHFNKNYFKGYTHYKGKPFEMALDLIDKLHSVVQKNDGVKLALSSDDLISNYNNNKKSALIGMEGAHPLEGKIERLQTIYDKGVRYLGITWSNSNSFADAAGYNQNGGLTESGKKLIKEMMKLGMLIDVSHISDKSFYDILKVTRYKYPIIASHSCARALLNHKRNLTDDMIRQIKKSAGVIGVVYHSGFLSRKKRATIEDLLDHIDYIVEKSSINHVALGSDFDGFIKTPKGLEDMSKLSNLTVGLYNRGYSLKDIEKILGANFLRVFKKVESLKGTSLN